MGGMGGEQHGNWIEVLFRQNRISGNIPASLLLLSSAHTLLLHDNSLSGTICSQLGSQLGYLTLSENIISGVIPSSLAFASLLQTLLLGENKLSGTVRKKLSLLTLLEYLHFPSNKLSGSSSPDFAKWTKLRLFSMQLNPLEWDLSLLKFWPVLEFGLAYGCQIHGTLPTSLVNEHLGAILLGQNAISGTMSKDIFTTRPNLNKLNCHTTQSLGCCQLRWYH